MTALAGMRDMVLQIFLKSEDREDKRKRRGQTSQWTGRCFGAEGGHKMAGEKKSKQPRKGGGKVSQNKKQA